MGSGYWMVVRGWCAVGGEWWVDEWVRGWVVMGSECVSGWGGDEGGGGSSGASVVVVVVVVVAVVEVVVAVVCDRVRACIHAPHSVKKQMCCTELVSAFSEL